MKILYINTSISPVGKFLVDSIREAFAAHSVKLEVLDFTAKCVHFYSMLQDHPRKIHISREYASALLDREIRGSDADYVFFVNGGDLDKKVLQSACKRGGRFICWQTDDPYSIDDSASYVPICCHIFTVDSAALRVYRTLGHKNAHFLPFAFATQLCTHSPRKEYASDICFIGTPFINSRRAALIDKVAPFLKNFKVRIIGSQLSSDSWHKALKNYALLKSFISEEFIPHDEAVKYMISSKINLNIHRDNCGHPIDRNKRHINACSPNDRVFTLAGIGAFQLVDDSRSDLRKLLKMEDEIVEFSDATDLKKKIEYYLAHEDERQVIAKAARERVISEHTYGQRVSEILSVIGR